MVKIFAFFCITVISCSIIPEGAMNSLPSTSYLKNITITRQDNNQTLTGTLSYEGGYANPNKIIIDWTGDLRLFQIPIYDNVSKITQTLYEFQNNRIQKISNMNDKNIAARTDQFIYNTTGLLKQHKQTEVYGSNTYTFQNVFYYFADLNLEYVFQTRCMPDSCYYGFLQDNSSQDNAAVGSKFQSYLPAQLDSITHLYNGISGDYYWFKYPYDFRNGSHFSITNTAGFPSETITNLVDQSNITELNFDGTIADQYPKNLFGISGGSVYNNSFCSVSKGNTEYFEHLYFKIGELINRNNSKSSENQYGVNVRWWIFPFLSMPIEYADYTASGYTLDSSERYFKISFTTSFQ